MKGLDDSKYIAAAIYVTSIVLAVTTVSTYTLMDYVNIYPAVVGMGFLLGTTMILALVFVPRVSSFVHECMTIAGYSGVQTFVCFSGLFFYIQLFSCLLVYVHVSVCFQTI